MFQSIYVASFLVALCSVKNILQPAFICIGTAGLLFSLSLIISHNNRKMSMFDLYGIGILVRIPIFLLFIFQENDTLLRIIALIADIITIFVIVSIVKKSNIAHKYSLIYSLNPVVLFVAISCDFKLLIVNCLISCALLICLGTKKWTIWILCICALLVHLYSAVFAIFTIRLFKNTTCYLIMLLLLICICFNCFVPIIDISGITGEITYNNLVYSLLLDTLHQSTFVTSLVLFALFLTGITLIYLVTPSIIVACRHAILLFLLLLPQCHVCCIVLIVPFVVLSKQLSWNILFYTVSLVVYFSNFNDITLQIRDTHCFVYGIWIPFLITYAIELLRNHLDWSKEFSCKGSISIVIPTLNEETTINACVNSIREQAIPAEIVVVDCGSNDKTVEFVRCMHDVKLINSDPGRGIQIAYGIASTSGDIIVVLHSDTILKKNSLKRMSDALMRNADASGGCFGLKYKKANFKMGIALFLHNVKSRLTGIAFGDQGQFFRRIALKDGFPSIRLMEDVELSMRLKENGKVLYLSDGVISSNRQWLTRGFIEYFSKVFFLVTYYLILRSLNILNASTDWFYNNYYKGKKSK